MKISIHQELVVKEMEIGELQLDNEVLEHNFIKLEEENQSLHVLMQLVQSQSIVHTVEPRQTPEMWTPR